MTRRMTWALGMLAATSGCGASVTHDGPADPMVAPPVASAGLCGHAGDAPLLVTIEGDDAFLVRGDETRVGLAVDQKTMPPDANVTLRADARGERVVVAASWVRIDEGVEVGNTLALFDAAGAKRYELSAVGWEASSVALAPGGELLLYRYFYDGGPGDQLVLDGDGASIALPSGFVADQWVGDGLLRGALDGAGAWLDVASGVVTELPATAAFAMWTHGWRDGFVALHQGKSAPWLYLESPAASELVVLWDVDSDDPTGLVLRGLNDDWMLLSDASERWWRVGLPLGEAKEIDPVSPLGPAPAEMMYCTPSPVLATAGDVVLTGGAPALTFQSVDPAGGWRALGDPVTAIETVDVRELDGTYLLEGVVGTFCPGVVGGATDDALTGASTQVVRPGIDAAFTIDATLGATIRPGGRCVGYRNDDGLRLLDVTTRDDELVQDGGGMIWWAP